MTPRRPVTGVPRRRCLVVWAGLLVVAVTLPVIGLATAWGDTTIVATPAVASPTQASASASSVASTAAASVAATAASSATVAATTSTAPSTLSVTLADLGVTGTVSVAAYDVTDGDELVAGAGSFETASVVKVDILVALLVQRSGSLTTAQKSLAREMITESDNDAATALYTAVGSASGLNATNMTLGLVETTAGTSGNWGLTRTTAADQIRLLRLVFQPSTILSPASQAYVVSLMTAVDVDQDWGISVADQDGVGYAIKDGWLPRTTIGSVQSGGHVLLLVVLVNRSSTMAAGITTIEKAARAAAQKLLTV
jgi:hypothetical protein